MFNKAISDVFDAVSEGTYEEFLKWYDGKSCIDYANEYSWRRGFIDIVKKVENDK